MNLIELLTPFILNAQPTIPNIQIAGLVTDNRDLVVGDCFIALAGLSQHGKTFIDDAITKGASAILLDGEHNESLVVEKQKAEIHYQANVPVIEIQNLKTFINALIIHFYQHHEAHAASVFDMPLWGVTGTNGKSSITRFVAQMSTALQQPSGLMGTLGYGVWPDISASKNTTPELAILLRQFSAMQRAGAQTIAMEVSSHGIEQNRIQGLTFYAAVFSNLSQDHLDYHGDMESYFAIKRELFLGEHLRYAIINIDDDYGQRLLADTSITAQKISYGFNPNADIRVLKSTSSTTTIDASITTPWGDADFTINMVGDFNLANVLAAIGLLAVQNVFEFQHIINAVQAITPAPGRMQTYSKTNCPTVVVDFAHTPDALSNVLSTLVKQTQGRLGVVFGCGGNRDTSKRPLMAAIAQQFADYVCLTTDNPRHENIESIIIDMQAGFTGNVDNENNAMISVELDRQQAIVQTLTHFNQHDMVLVAGKGHEAYQDIKGEKIPYSDEAVLLAQGYQDIQAFNKEAL